MEITRHRQSIRLRTCRPRAGGMCGQASGIRGSADADVHYCQAADNCTFSNVEFFGFIIR